MFVEAHGEVFTVLLAAVATALARVFFSEGQGVCQRVELRHVAQILQKRRAAFVTRGRLLCRQARAEHRSPWTQGPAMKNAQLETLFELFYQCGCNACGRAQWIGDAQVRSFAGRCHGAYKQIGCNARRIGRGRNAPRLRLLTARSRRA